MLCMLACRLVYYVLYASSLHSTLIKTYDRAHFIPQFIVLNLAFNFQIDEGTERNNYSYFFHLSLFDWKAYLTCFYTKFE